MLEGSEDVHVPKFSISMGGKTLFKDSKLSLIHGRRYGLIGARLARRQGARRLLVSSMLTNVLCRGRTQRLR